MGANPEAHDVHAASLYINNLLVSRGLLKNGMSIDFANPDEAEGGTNATMAKVINLVHDLILRRDRDADRHESLAIAITNMKTKELKDAANIDKLRARVSETERQISLVQAQERAAKASLNSAENTARDLQEQILRLKITLRQVRARSVNDIRDRDTQIKKLESHVAARRRGTAQQPVADIRHTKSCGATEPAVTEKGSCGVPLDSPNYTLAQESTEFLTKLSQSLSDENDNLIELVRSTLTTLRVMQGLPTLDKTTAKDAVGDLSNSGEQSSPYPIPCEVLAAEMEEVLGHLKIILTNPSYVPIEELEIREDEIKRLKKGCDSVEAKFQQLFNLIDGWHKRISSRGRSVSAQELQVGLKLGQGEGHGVDVDFNSKKRSRPTNVPPTTIKAPVEDLPGHKRRFEEEIFAEEKGESNSDSDVEKVNDKEFDSRLVLAELTNTPSEEEVEEAFTSIAEENTQDIWLDNHPEEVALFGKSAHSQAPAQPPIFESRIPRHNPLKRPAPFPAADGSENPSGADKMSATARTKRRISILKKMHNARREAVDAQVAHAEPAAAESGARPGKQGGEKRSARSSRRRSTLSPQELEDLIVGGL
ncbi:MAG: hypothetical protein M1829_006383 [Trizodia sp. TS-e1964]|nr:MAG: hypothetical protein M1829_006383 [Trizodia sp. TS-e1964]